MHIVHAWPQVAAVPVLGQRHQHLVATAAVLDGQHIGIQAVNGLQNVLQEGGPVAVNQRLALLEVSRGLPKAAWELVIELVCCHRALRISTKTGRRLAQLDIGYPRLQHET